MVFVVPRGNRLLVTRDGTLWIGTFAGLVTWNGGKLTQRPELGREFVASLFEDHQGTVWASSLAGKQASGRLCAIRSNGTQCYGEDGASAEPSGLCMKIVQAISGPPHSPGLGD